MTVAAMSATAQLLIPALYAGDDGRFTAARAGAHAALDVGVGGFVLHGGEQDAVRTLTKELQLRSRTPLLIGADLERGAGQQFTGATGLPPLAALAWLGDAEALRRAGRLTAREARTMGVNWDLAPVVDVEPSEEGAAAGTRSLGADPIAVARMAAEWITACQAEGVLACAKHFPGIGRATYARDGSPPVVTTAREVVEAADLAPFRAAIDAGVASMMAAHVSYPALDPSGLPASCSRELIQWLLRQQMRFDNLVVADGAAIARASADPRAEADAAVRAIAAGCDLIVMPTDAASLAAALDLAVADRRLDGERVRQSGRRRLKWAQWASPPNDWRRPTASDTAWGAQLADRVVHLTRGTAPPIAAGMDVLVVADSPHAVASVGVDAFLHTLRTAGAAVRATDVVTAGTAPLAVAVLPSADEARGEAAEATGTAERIAALVGQARDVGRTTLVVLFAHPRLTRLAPPDVPVLVAWTADPAMQRAAARWLTARRA